MPCTPMSVFSKHLCNMVQVFKDCSSVCPLVQFISYDKRLIIKIYTTCVFRHLKFPFIMTEVMTKHKYCIQDQIIINQNSPSARTLQALIITQ